MRRLTAAGYLLLVAAVLTAEHANAQGFFESLFGFPRVQLSAPPTPKKQRVVRPRPEVRVESSRAPAPRKNNPKEATASIVLVTGDGMAEWLAFGLEDVFSEAPQVSVQRRTSLDSGLIKYAEKTDKTWPLIPREILSKEKADYVIVMLGLSNRQEIQEKHTKGDDLSPNIQTNIEAENAKAGPNLETPAPNGNNKALGALPFRSEEWTKAYAKRIDDLGAVLRSKGVPVFWAGLPSARGNRAMSDVAFLNGLYRSRAEHAGITFIDVWDGFVDDDGKYSAEGPDFEGQVRRLRSSDGVFFTNSGARKLAHYVERELRRYINGGASSNLLPKAPIDPAIQEQSVERPLSGPVFPLTAPMVNSDELLGAGRNVGQANEVSTKVLQKGEAIAGPVGRADNFSWPITAVSGAGVVGKAKIRDISAKTTARN